ALSRSSGETANGFCGAIRLDKTPTPKRATTSKPQISTRPAFLDRERPRADSVCCVVLIALRAMVRSDICIRRPRRLASFRQQVMLEDSALREQCRNSSGVPEDNRLV